MSAEAVRAGEDGAADVGESASGGSGSGSASATAASTAASLSAAAAPEADIATPAGTASAAPRPEFPGSNDLDTDRPPDGHTLTRVSTNPQPPPPSTAAATKPAAASSGSTASPATRTSPLTAVADHTAATSDPAAGPDDPASPSSSSSAHAVPPPLAALQNLVGPSTFLRPAPRPAGYPMTREESQASAQSISALDREQIEGLVSCMLACCPRIPWN